MQDVLSVSNDVAAELGGTEFLDPDDVQDFLLTEVLRVSSIVELSVFEYTPSGTSLIASTVKPPEFTPERLGTMTSQPKPVEGSHGEHLMAVRRMDRSHPGVTIIAVSTLEELYRSLSARPTHSLIIKPLRSPIRGGMRPARRLPMI